MRNRATLNHVFVGALLCFCACESRKPEDESGQKTKTSVTAQPKSNDNAVTIPKALNATYEEIKLRSFDRINISSETVHPPHQIKSDLYEQFFGNMHTGLAFQQVSHDALSGVVAYFEFPSVADAESALSRAEASEHPKPIVFRQYSNFIVAIQVRGHNQQDLSRYSGVIFSLLDSQ